ncbi:MAG: hypothetical protein J1E62_07660 [Lachnospiraceae bacterium]|nr:hypothetical protein [Lachnospiraceae bacterium]
MRKRSKVIFTAVICIVGVFGGKRTMAQERMSMLPIPSDMVEPTAIYAEEPMQVPEESPAPEPTEKPALPALKKVTGVKAVRFSTNAVKIIWKKHKKAKYYRVYYSIKGKGKYRLAGVTTDTHFLVTKLKNKKTYSFYVIACRNKRLSPADSKASKKVHMKMKTYQRKIVFAGDSICQGIGQGWSFPRMHSGAKKKIVAYKGLSTITYQKKKLFNGKTALQKLISEKPYRVYMILGLNDVHARRANLIIADYKDLVCAIQQGSPNTDIVLCAVSPVTRGACARKPGMRQIPLFNRKLKKMSKKMGVRYFDYTEFLKDSKGYMKARYAAKDGYHWKPAAYVTFGKVVGKYDRALDR